MNWIKLFVFGGLMVVCATCMADSMGKIHEEMY